MTIDEYALALGTLVSSLHSLEFALRAFLLKHNEEREPPVNAGELAVGERVPVNCFTSYASLGKLVDAFNDVVASRSPSSCLDRTVVDLRDMIAHGRVAGRAPELPFELLKFGQERDNMVLVVDKVTLDAGWLGSRIGFVREQTLKVMGASQDLRQGIMDKV